MAGVAGAVIALAGQQWGTRAANRTRAGELAALRERNKASIQALANASSPVIRRRLRAV